MTKEDKIKKVIAAGITNASYDWVILADVPSKVANYVFAHFGYDIKGYKYVLESTSVKHIYGRHGACSNDRIKLIARDFAKLPNILANPDKITKGGLLKQNNLPTLLFKKRIGEKYVYVSLCDIRSGRGSLSVYSFRKRTQKKTTKK